MISLCVGSVGHRGLGSTREDLYNGGVDGHDEGDDLGIGTYARESHCHG